MKRCDCLLVGLTCIYVVLSSLIHAQTFPATQTGTMANMPGVHALVLGRMPEKILQRAVSDDGRHLAVVTQIGTKMQVLLDGKLQFECDDIRIEALKFSPGGKHLQYLAVFDFGSVVILDGLVLPSQRRFSGDFVTFSTEDEHTARRVHHWGQCRVLVDGQLGAGYEMILKNTLVFSPDGKHLAYMIEQNKRQAVVVDGRVGAWHEG